MIYLYCGLGWLDKYQKYWVLFLKKEEKKESSIIWCTLLQVKATGALTFVFSYIFFWHFIGVITTYFNTCTCRSSCDCWQLQCKSCTWQKRKENNFLKKSCVVSEIRYEFFPIFSSLLWLTNSFFFENEQAQKKDNKIHRIEFKLLFRLGLGKTWFKTDHCWLDLILDVKWVLCMCS